MPTTEYWFRCPANHLQYIDEEQLQGDDSITCSKCGWQGTVDEGELAG